MNPLRCEVQLRFVEDAQHLAEVELVHEAEGDATEASRVAQDLQGDTEHTFVATVHHQVVNDRRHDRDGQLGSRDPRVGIDCTAKDHAV
ncbi:hypothetical protein NUW54_g9470 [Trametes sanguinea]|uniref:Uncharacterized protein n=1 Tax=Trametes sanguinea TaxID=158606 RepID=A0ACC1P893_9APHY|nr:hypothetical protein NUW54_g9470 [Trametes sanguinea]